MPALIGGKKGVDVLSKQFGNSAETIEAWRVSALEGIELAMHRGSEPSRREHALEGENASLARGRCACWRARRDSGQSWGTQQAVQRYDA